jgi:DNA invertase Pin-like site-specific DNA recombinase
LSFGQQRRQRHGQCVRNPHHHKQAGVTLSPFDRLHTAIVRREIDMVATWSVNRLGRSLQDLVAFLAELQASRCELYLHQQGLDTSTPAGRALFGTLSVFADFERAMIVERTKAGLARARAQGKLIGRPKVPLSWKPL